MQLKRKNISENGTKTEKYFTTEITLNTSSLHLFTNNKQYYLLNLLKFLCHTYTRRLCGCFISIPHPPHGCENWWSRHLILTGRTWCQVTCIVLHIGQWAYWQWWQKSNTSHTLNCDTRTHAQQLSSNWSCIRCLHPMCACIDRSLVNWWW